MSVNLYIKKSIETENGFKEKSGGCSFMGKYLYKRRGEDGWYIAHPNIYEPIAKTIEPFIENISLYETFPRFHTERTIGRYSDKDTSAILDITPDGRNYSLRMWGQNQKDMSDLYHKIRGGKIEPYEKWDGN